MYAMKGNKKLNRVLLGLEMVNGDVIIKILLRFICVYSKSNNGNARGLQPRVN